MPEETGQLAAKREFFGLPGSWVGWASVVLALVGVVAVFVRRPFGNRGVFAAFIAAGAVALVAALWKKERSALVWIPLVVGVLAALWAVAELLFPH